MQSFGGNLGEARVDTLKHNLTNLTVRASQPNITTKSDPSMYHNTISINVEKKILIIFFLSLLFATQKVHEISRDLCSDRMNLSPNT